MKCVCSCFRCDQCTSRGNFYYFLHHQLVNLPPPHHLKRFILIKNRIQEKQNESEHPGQQNTLWRAGSMKAILEYKTRVRPVLDKEISSTPPLLLFWCMITRFLLTIKKEKRDKILKDAPSSIFNKYLTIRLIAALYNYCQQMRARLRGS